LSSLLDADQGALGGIARHARRLERVRRAILAALPGNAAPHLQVAAVDAQRLLLHVDSTAWATRLRYAVPAMRRQLAQQLRLHVETIRIQVRTSPITPHSASVIRHISATNRRHIQRVAKHVDDPALARALQRLADHAAATGRALT